MLIMSQASSEPFGTCIEGLWEGFTKEGWEELDGFICDELEEGAYISLKRPSEATSPYGWAFRKLPDLSKDLGVPVPEGLSVMPLRVFQKK